MTVDLLQRDGPGRERVEHLDDPPMDPGEPFAQRLAPGTRPDHARLDYERPARRGFDHRIARDIQPRVDTHHPRLCASRIWNLGFCINLAGHGRSILPIRASDSRLRRILSLSYGTARIRHSSLNTTGHSPQPETSERLNIVPTLCVGMPSGTLPRPRASADHAERGRRHSHGDRGNEKGIRRSGVRRGVSFFRHSSVNTTVVTTVVRPWFGRAQPPTSHVSATRLRIGLTPEVGPPSADRSRPSHALTCLVTAWRLAQSGGVQREVSLFSPQAARVEANLAEAAVTPVASVPGIARRARPSRFDSRSRR